MSEIDALRALPSILASMAESLDSRASWSRNSRDRDTPGTVELMRSASAECKAASAALQNALPALSDEVDRLLAFAGAVSAHMDDLARCASIFRENGMPETADETEKAVSELRVAWNRRDGGSDGG